MEKSGKNRNFFSGLKSKFRLFFVQDYFRSYIVIWLIVLSFMSNFANWISIKIFIKPVNFPIILHYNVYFGVDMVGNRDRAYILPAIGLFLLLVNLLLSIYFYKRGERIASYLLLMAGLMSQLSLIIASVGIVVINY